MQSKRIPKIELEKLAKNNYIQFLRVTQSIKNWDNEYYEEVVVPIIEKKRLEDLYGEQSNNKKKDFLIYSLLFVLIILLFFSFYVWKSAYQFNTELKEMKDSLINLTSDFNELNKKYISINESNKTLLNNSLKKNTPIGIQESYNSKLFQNEILLKSNNEFENATDLEINIVKTARQLREVQRKIRSLEYEIKYRTVTDEIEMKSKKYEEMALNEYVPLGDKFSSLLSKYNNEGNNVRDLAIKYNFLDLLR